jgi:hypothetical protein
MTDYIKILNDVIMESEMNVMNSIINYIDKGDLVNEYGTESCVNDIFMESMMWFMESKNRERDRTPRNDISKWMEKEGLWYTGDNPNKKKLSNRIYHFLQQHDFNPSDETYKSDIKNKDGSNKRLKLKLEINGRIRLSQEEKDIVEKWKKHHLIKTENGKLIFDWLNILSESDEEEDELAKILLNLKEIHGGDNAFYLGSRDEIYMSINTLKHKQSDSQITLKHEEGHAYDKKDNAKTDSDIKEINKIKEDSDKHKKDATKIGMRSNDHDAESDESFADVYAVKNAKIRTKKNSIRNISNKDLLKTFERMDKHMRDSGFKISIDDCSKRITRLIDTCETVLNDDKAVQFKNLINLTDRVGAIGDAVERIHRRETEIDTELSLLDKSDDELKALEKNLKSTLSTLAFSSRALRYEISDKLDMIEDFLDGFKPSNIDKRKESLEKSRDRIRRKETDHVESLPNKPFRGGAGYNEAMSSGMITLSLNNKDINEIMSKAKTRKEAESMILDKLKPSIKRIQEKLKATKKSLEELKKTNNTIKDVSTRVRYEFAKKYIKEYFDEFFGDSDLYVE